MLLQQVQELETENNNLTSTVKEKEHAAEAAQLRLKEMSVLYEEERTNRENVSFECDLKQHFQLSVCLSAIQPPACII